MIESSVYWGYRPGLMFVCLSKMPTLLPKKDDLIIDVLIPPFCRKSVPLSFQRPNDSAGAHSTT